MSLFASDAFRHVAPFCTWMLLMNVLPADAAGYALRSAATAAVGVWCWRRSGFRLPSGVAEGRSWRWGLAAGIAVAVLWIAPEHCGWYRRLLLWGQAPAAPEPSPYSPAACGWPLTVAKLAGSAFVIAPVEEVFFRSFLYRQLIGRDFAAVPLSRFDRSAFLWTVALFALEHPPRIAAGAMAGAVYGLLTVRLNLFAAILAHTVTNLALALWVIAAGDWNFW